VSDIPPLAGENENQLNAYAARYREARIAYLRAYGAAEHRGERMPEQSCGRKQRADERDGLVTGCDCIDGTLYAYYA
jgi:hypothetical protein